VAGIITLLTDFGVESTYPGQMKGVILERLPGAVVVDMSHGVPRHDVHTAAFMLASAAPAFPEGTVHVAVVDPEVGSSRRVLAAEGGGHLYLAPDNGLLTLVAQRRRLFGGSAAAGRVVAVENASFFRADVASTFHGRDIFAPLAAALASGTPLEGLGPQVEAIERFDVPLPQRQENTIRGQVLHVDPFGNLITNIAGEMLMVPGASAVEIHISGAVIRGLCRAYCEVAAGMLLAYVGSAGLVEVAVNRQSAALRLGAGIGTRLTVRLPSAS